MLVHSCGPIRGEYCGQLTNPSSPEDHLPALGDGVADGEGEGDGAAQPREHHHVLDAGADLYTAPEVQHGCNIKKVVLLEY